MKKMFFALLLSATTTMIASAATVSPDSCWQANLYSGTTTFVDGQTVTHFPGTISLSLKKGVNNSLNATISHIRIEAFFGGASMMTVNHAFDALMSTYGRYETPIDSNNIALDTAMVKRTYSYNTAIPHASLAAIPSFLDIQVPDPQLKARKLTVIVEVFELVSAWPLNMRKSIDTISITIDNINYITSPLRGDYNSDGLVNQSDDDDYLDDIFDYESLGYPSVFGQSIANYVMIGDTVNTPTLMWSPVQRIIWKECFKAPSGPLATYFRFGQHRLASDDTLMQVIPQLGLKSAKLKSASSEVNIKVGKYSIIHLKSADAKQGVTYILYPSTGMATKIVGDDISTVGITWTDGTLTVPDPGFAYTVYGSGNGLNLGVIDTQLSVSDLKSAKISVFPNPTTDQLQVRDLKGRQQLAIFDISGKQVLSGTIDEGEAINVSGLRPGLYVLKMNDGKTMSNAKFFKQ